MINVAGNVKAVEVGEVGLYRSVVTRAIMDLFGSLSLTSQQDEARAARDDALSFLTAETGGWAQSRNTICETCDIEPSILRSRVVAILEGRDPPDEARQSVFTNLDAARDLWAKKKTETARAQAARERQAKIVAHRRAEPQKRKRTPVRHRYSELRLMVFDLLRREPMKFKDILQAMGGVSDHAIRTLLNNALAKGEVVRSSTYVYSLAPSSSVVAEPEAA